MASSTSTAWGRVNVECRSKRCSRGLRRLKPQRRMSRHLTSKGARSFNGSLSLSLSTSGCLGSVANKVWSVDHCPKDDGPDYWMLKLFGVGTLSAEGFWGVSRGGVCDVR
jgi:hypothetical protein